MPHKLASAAASATSEGAMAWQRPRDGPRATAQLPHPLRGSERGYADHLRDPRGSDALVSKEYVTCQLTTAQPPSTVSAHAEACSAMPC